MAIEDGVPNPCFVLRHPLGGMSRRVAEGLLVFSSKEKVVEHVGNFFPEGEVAEISSFHIDDLRSSFASIVVDYTSRDQSKVVIDISNGTGVPQQVIGF